MPNDPDLPPCDVCAAKNDDRFIYRMLNTPYGMHLFVLCPTHATMPEALRGEADGKQHRTPGC